MPYATRPDVAEVDSAAFLAKTRIVLDTVLADVGDARNPRTEHAIARGLKAMVWKRISTSGLRLREYCLGLCEGTRYLPVNQNECRCDE
jgi:hypothetical protein